MRYQQWSILIDETTFEKKTSFNDKRQISNIDVDMNLSVTMKNDELSITTLWLCYKYLKVQQKQICDPGILRSSVGESVKKKIVRDPKYNLWNLVLKMGSMYEHQLELRGGLSLSTYFR